MISKRYIVGFMSLSFFLIGLILIIINIFNDGWVVSLDYRIMEYVYSLRSPSINSFMIWFTDFASHTMMVIMSILIVVFTLLKKKYYILAVYLITFGISLLTSSTLKVIIQRPRPGISPLVDVNGYSFPSGHSMSSFVFYLLLVFVIYSLSNKSRAWIYALLISVPIILLIGFSRVYLGVHYPSDAIGGYFAGSIVLISMLLLNLHMQGIFEKE
jgi:undecaprenyl-diphosphatase